MTDRPETTPEEARRAAFEEVAMLHDAEAARLSRLRDVGMANHHRAWAKKVRDLGGIATPIPAADRGAIPLNVRRLEKRI